MISKSKYIYSYFINYIPKNVHTDNPSHLEDRRDVFALMNGEVSDKYMSIIIEEVKIITSSNPSEWCVCFIPASTSQKTYKRYNTLSKRISEELKVKVTLNAITLSEREAKHLTVNKDSVKSLFTFNVNEYYGKKVILIDDIIVTGGTFRSIGDYLMMTGAIYIHGMFFAKSVHPKKLYLNKVTITKKKDVITQTSNGKYVLTSDMIEAAKTPKGGFNARQLKVFGIDWPPFRGWKESLIGKTISVENYQLFINYGKNIEKS